MIHKNFSYIALVFLLIIRFICFLLGFNIPILDFLIYGGFFLVFLLFFSKKELIRNYHRDLTKTVFIITISYFILYYFLGVVVGFTYNIYNTSLLGILSNTFFLIIPLLLREEVRKRFVFLHKNKIACVFVTIVFILCEVFGSTFFNFQTNEEFFSQFVSVLLPIVIENILLTYLSFVGIRSTTYAYFIPMLISRYFIPIVVDLDWFYRLLLQLAVTLIIYFFIMNEYLWHVKRIYSKRTDKKNSFLYIALCLFVLCFGLFIAGVFTYQPVAVLTYSMVPTFTRGDAVIVKKLDEDEVRKLKKGDIIQYQYNNQAVVLHRIVDVYRLDGELVYVLKGDNNDSVDSDVVHTDQILGKVIFSIPKIGYPSVWLSEFLYPDREVEVEVGR